MFVVDTNILIYAINDSSPYCEPSRVFLETCRQQSGAWHLTWGCCYEFLRIATHPKMFGAAWPAKRALHFLDVLMMSPSLEMLVATNRHKFVAAEVIAEMPTLAGNIMHDAETAILMREHGIKTIYTRDMDFHRFDFIKVIDPTAAM
jgi:toxin-antitoxin system PIN domain toxin